MGVPYLKKYITVPQWKIDLIIDINRLDGILDVSRAYR